MTSPETGTEWQFDNSGAGFPQKIIESEGAGNTISLEYHESELSHVADSHGDAVTIPRNHTTGLVTTIEGTGAKSWTYSYNTSHQLSKYENPAKEKTTYTYSSGGLLERIEDPSGTYVISYESSDPHRVLSLRHLVNGTVTVVGNKDEITAYEYKTPQTPTCNLSTDASETVVTYKPSEATETYCFDSSDHFTGPKSESEEEIPETTEPQTAEPEGTCTEPAVWKDCELEEAPPESTEDLPARGYGIADNNWLQSKPHYEEEAHEKIKDSITPFPYFTNSYFTALKVHYLRRTMPWNTALEAEYDEKHPEKEGHEGQNPGARARRSDTEYWIKEAKRIGAVPIISFERCPKEAKWADPTEGEKPPAKSCEEPPSTKAYELAMKAFEKRPVLAEVLNFSAWNEPNNPKQPTSPLPRAKLAGEYWRVLDKICVLKPKEKPPTPECHVAADEFSDEQMPNAMAKKSTGGEYFAKYVEGTGRTTTLNRWAWHSYKDGISTQEPGKRDNKKTWWVRYKHFKEAVDRKMEHAKCVPCRTPNIWLTEQGVLYYQHSEPITVTLARAHGTHPALTSKIIGNPKIAEAVMDAYVQSHSHEITRQGQVPLFLYYSVIGAPASFDSGLLETPEALPKELKHPVPVEAPRAIYRIYEQKTLHGG